MGSSLFARRYWGNRFFFLFLWVLRCFSSPGCLPITIFFIIGSSNITLTGFSHSDICVSSLACSSAQLFAAYRVLLRLLAPRHPPNALFSLTFRLFLFFNSFFPCDRMKGCLACFFLAFFFCFFSRSEFLFLPAFCFRFSPGFSFFPLWLLFRFRYCVVFKERSFFAFLLWKKASSCFYLFLDSITFSV